MAQPKTSHPIGTLPQLLKCGINPGRYASCAPPDNSPNSPVIGCTWAKSCRCRGKFKKVENLAVLTVSAAGGRDIVEMPCYHYNSRLRDMRLSGNGFEIVAYEGDEYLAKASREEVVGQTHKGPKVHVKLFREKRTVATFPNPEDNPLLEDEIANLEVSAFVETREENRRRQDTIGHASARERVAQMRPDAYDKEEVLETTTTGTDDEVKVSTVKKAAAKPAPKKAKPLTVHSVKKGPNAKKEAAIARAEDLDAGSEST